MGLLLSNLRKLVGTGAKCPVKVGQKLLVCTVTRYYTGEVKDVSKYPDVVLKNAAWIADTGRFANALKSCDFSEVEPYNRDVHVNFSSYVDFTEIDKLPLEQK